MKNKVFAVMGLVLLCLFAVSTFTQMLLAQQKTQGEFAIELCKALDLEVPSEDYIAQLETRGLTPEGGWQIDKPISNTEMAKMLSKALELAKKPALRETEEVYRDKATIVKLAGKVDIKVGEKGEWAPAQEGMKLTQNDFIRTGPDSWVDLRVGIVGGVKIKENSEIKLSELSSNLDGSENITLYMTIGEMLVDARGLKKGSDFQVQTTTTVAAVRGTIYNIKVVGEKTEIKE